MENAQLSVRPPWIAKRCLACIVPFQVDIGIWVIILTCTFANLFEITKFIEGCGPAFGAHKHPTK